MINGTGRFGAPAAAKTSKEGVATFLTIGLVY